ncbi:DUF6879 family protein [Nocardiopsis sp. FIRDI 009]|uniref:DUF6879 family protein n=1 Tax=Nocardiopsis sp. FIRDI 009 TaxID=714197 RepID=UPI000E239401|nr:DUF6879 family protein [Nocardiopsis sp. FIRDI 009]
MPPNYDLLRQRARALAEVTDQDWLTPKQATRITGLSRHILRTRARSGALIAHRPSSRRNYAYLKQSLLDLVADTGPLTIFDTALRMASSNGTALGTDALHEEEKALCNSDGHTGTCWQLDTRSMNDTTDEALRSWLRGHYRHALNLLAGHHSPLMERVALHTSTGTTVHTVWAPQVPMTPYNQLQLEAYRIQAAAGIPTRVLRPSDRSHLEYEHTLPHLVVYPGRFVYVLRHTPHGGSDGAIRLDHPALADGLADQLRDLYERALPLERFARPYL